MFTSLLYKCDLMYTGAGQRSVGLITSSLYQSWEEPLRLQLSVRTSAAFLELKIVLEFHSAFCT